MKKVGTIVICLIGLIWVAHTALYVDNDFQVYTIMIWGVGFVSSALLYELQRVREINRKTET